MFQLSNYDFVFYIENKHWTCLGEIFKLKLFTGFQPTKVGDLKCIIKKLNQKYTLLKKLLI